MITNQFFGLQIAYKFNSIHSHSFTVVPWAMAVIVLVVLLL